MVGNRSVKRGCTPAQEPPIYADRYGERANLRLQYFIHSMGSLRKASSLDDRAIGVNRRPLSAFVRVPRFGFASSRHSVMNPSLAIRLESPATSLSPLLYAA